MLVVVIIMVVTVVTVVTVMVVAIAVMMAVMVVVMSSVYIAAGCYLRSLHSRHLCLRVVLQAVRVGLRPRPQTRATSLRAEGVASLHLHGFSGGEGVR